MAEKAKLRPKNAPPEKRPKKTLDVVYASSADGRVFAIPMDKADGYELTRDRLENKQDPPLLPYSLLVQRLGGAAEQAEVGGRHTVLLVDGTYGYHSDWLYGSYVWITDGRAYTGNHWHPNRYSPLAYDEDNY